jgi:hypothetical protein
MNKNILIWDIENIPYHFKDQVFNHIKNDPIKKYIVSKRKFDEKQLDIFKNDGFTFMSAKYHKDADSKIIDLMKILLLNASEITLVTSDSDFVNFIFKYKDMVDRFNIIMNEHNKKRILMKSDITDPKVKYFTVGDKVQNKRIAVKNQKPLKKWSEAEYAEILRKRKYKKDVKKKIFNHLNIIDNKNGKTHHNFNKKNKLDETNISSDNGKKNVKIDGIKYFVNFEEWVELQTERIINRNVEQFSNIGTCSICREEKANIKYGNCYEIYFCHKCEKEWISKQKIFKEMYGNKYSTITHEERLLSFFYEKDIEYKINSFINYTYDDFDTVDIEISKLNIPHVFLSDEKSTKEIVYQDDFSNFALAEFLKKEV